MSLIFKLLRLHPTLPAGTSTIILESRVLEHVLLSMSMLPSPENLFQFLVLVQEKFSISVDQFISNIKILEVKSRNITESITSWARKFFTVENRVVVDHKTGVESSLKFDVCKLPIKADGSETCGKN